jgi:hypothetical protein
MKGKKIFWKVLAMTYNTRNYWVFGLCPWLGILKNTRFRKLYLFPPSGEALGDTYSVLGLLERADLQ